MPPPSVRKFAEAPFAWLQILWKDLNVQKQIGEGSFGKVYLAKWRETTVAAKVLLGGTTNSTDEEFPNRDSPLLDGLTKVGYVPQTPCLPAVHRQHALRCLLQLVSG